jgi:3-phosphoshikimate 1-carboxyvinyltransferase
MLVAPYARRDTTLTVVEDLASAPYVLLTSEVMRAFGVEAKKGEAGTFTVRSGQRYIPAEYEVEPDASGASYPMAAAAIAGGRVFLPGVGEDSLQGDARFTDVLRAMGCDIRAHDNGLTVLREGALRGTEVDMNGMPDVVPTLVAVALFAEGGTRILHVAHLRYKESDRGEGLAAELRKLGADVRMNGETMEVNPVPLRGARLDVHDDHRLAMSFALIGLRVPGVEVENPECVRKSFPEFWTEFDRLRPA